MASRQNFLPVVTKLASAYQQCSCCAGTGTAPESAGSNSRVPNSQHSRAKFIFTAADQNRKPASGVLRPTKASFLKAQGKTRATKKEKDPSTGEEINWVNAEVLASLEFNGSFNGSINSRRASNASSDHVKETSGLKQPFKENNNKNMRRTRWQ